MQARKPVVAGQFYPADKANTESEIRELLAGAHIKTTLPDDIVAAIVPHAGWTFSGKLCAMAFKAIKQRHERVDTFVIFGAAHSYFGMSCALSDRTSWLTPLGEVFVDEELTEQLIESGAAVADSSAHGSEHSIEVQVPFIQTLFSDAKIVPIIVPATREAPEIGNKVAELVKQGQKKIVCIGSTDLTHYGPRYGYMPMGLGKAATNWATNINDVRFIDAALKLDSEEMIYTALQNQNACGPGAAGACVTFAKAMGKEAGHLLAHINSNEVMNRIYGPSEDTVGYTAIVF